MHNAADSITQISLNKAYDTSSFTLDGGLNLNSGISPLIEPTRSCI